MCIEYDNKSVFVNLIYWQSRLNSLFCARLEVIFMNRLTARKRPQVIAALVEGNSIRATVRMTGACVLEEDRELGARGCPSFHAVQTFAACTKLCALLLQWKLELQTISGPSRKSWGYWKNRMKKRRHKNSEASLSAGLAPEFRRTRGDKIIKLDYGLYDSVSRKSSTFLFHLILSVSD